MNHAALTATLALVMSGCIAPPAGGAPSPSPMSAPTAVATTSTTAEASPRASPSVSPSASPSPTLPPAEYEDSDEPEHEWVADPVKRFVDYGRRHAGEFGGLYLEGPTVVMMFTDDLAKHEKGLAEIARGRPVRVIPCRYTHAALDALMMSLVDDFMAMLSPDVQPMSLGVDTLNNVVKIELKSDDPTLKKRLERPHDGMLVVNVYPMPGPWANVASGDGWRLVGHGRTSGREAYVVRAATTPTEWDVLWAAIDGSGPQPDIDLGREIAISFAHGTGSSCPELRLDDVEIDHPRRLLYSSVSDPLSPRACTADLVAAVHFVVALERDALPASPFTVRLKEHLICSDGSCGNIEEIQIDLRP